MSQCAVRCGRHHGTSGHQSLRLHTSSAWCNRSIGYHIGLECREHAIDAGHNPHGGRGRRHGDAQRARCGRCRMRSTAARCDQPGNADRASGHRCTETSARETPCTGEGGPPCKRPMHCGGATTHSTSPTRGGDDAERGAAADTALCHVAWHTRCDHLHMDLQVGDQASQRCMPVCQEPRRTQGVLVGGETAWQDSVCNVRRGQLTRGGS
mmetsp:Transcript_34856/g.81412  ORF Transcript_34856/g.81412 Transcript_34856/m.81412 type:complete len:210 (-) Transcript_34856:56-685(-)